MEKKKIFVILGILLSILLILVVVNKVHNSPSYKLKEMLKELGFVSKKDSDIYIKTESEFDEDRYLELVSDKVNSSYQVLYFNLANKKLTSKELKYEDGISTSFISNYDNVKRETTYTYRVVYDNSSVIFKGEYNLEDNKYTCENIYMYEFDVDLGGEDICNKIKYDVEGFNIKALKIFKKIND